MTQEATLEATATTDQDDQGQVEETDPHAEKIAELNEKLAEAGKAAKQSARALEQLAKADIKSGPAFDAIKATADAAMEKVESIKAAIENENKKYQLQKIAQPLVDAIGEVEVKGKLPTTLNVGDLPTRKAKVKEELEAAQATLSFYEHVEAALAKVEIDQASWDNMRPLNIIRIPDTDKVKVTIASRAGRSAGSGDGRASSREQVTITKANDDFKHLVGRKIYGEGADYTTWTDLLQKEVPEVEAERQAKIKAGSNTSAKIVAHNKLGVEAE